jgi:ADP-ribose pyrophosphatase YjhB (NUDIX family)
VKPLKRSVALVIEGSGGVLLVRRPDDDESLPGVWGLPAATLRAGEREEEALRRAGREKLGVALVPLRAIGEEEGERPGYRLLMRDWEVAIESGEPTVPQAAGGTQYVEARWGELGDLAPAARAGSLCARLLLRERHLGSVE